MFETNDFHMIDNEIDEINKKLEIIKYMRNCFGLNLEYLNKEYPYNAKFSFFRNKNIVLFKVIDEYSNILAIKDFSKHKEKYILDINKAFSKEHRLFKDVETEETGSIYVSTNKEMVEVYRKLLNLYKIPKYDKNGENILYPCFDYEGCLEFKKYLDINIDSVVKEIKEYTDFYMLYTNAMAYQIFIYLIMEEIPKRILNNIYTLIENKEKSAISLLPVFIKKFIGTNILNNSRNDGDTYYVSSNKTSFTRTISRVFKQGQKISNKEAGDLFDTMSFEEYVNRIQKYLSNTLGSSRNSLRSIDIHLDLQQSFYESIDILKSPSFLENSLLNHVVKLGLSVEKNDLYLDIYLDNLLKIYLDKEESESKKTDNKYIEFEIFQTEENRSISLQINEPRFYNISLIEDIDNFILFCLYGSYNYNKNSENYYPPAISVLCFKYYNYIYDGVFMKLPIRIKVRDLILTLSKLNIFNPSKNKPPLLEKLDNFMTREMSSSNKYKNYIFSQEELILEILETVKESYLASIYFLQNLI